jgi:hypothetical protein
MTNGAQNAKKNLFKKIGGCIFIWGHKDSNTGYNTTLCI